MIRFDPNEYGPTFAPLLSVDRLRPLDGGMPDLSRRKELDKLTVDSAFFHAQVLDPEMARCCLAGVWLLHDFLDASHKLSQNIDTPSGSFWHGIMHRREGDYSNAKYWFRRVELQEVFLPQAERATELASHLGVTMPKSMAHAQWDPFAFVDACQRAVRTGEQVELCCALQQAEWELLFDFCYRSARGPSVTQ